MGAPENAMKYKFQCWFSQNANIWSVTGRYVRTIRAIPTKIGTDTLFDMANVVIEPFFFEKKSLFFIVKKKLNFSVFFSQKITIFHNFGQILPLFTKKILKMALLRHFGGP